MKRLSKEQILNLKSGDKIIHELVEGCGCEEEDLGNGKEIFSIIDSGKADQWIIAENPNSGLASFLKENITEEGLCTDFFGGFYNKFYLKKARRTSKLIYG